MSYRTTGPAFWRDPRVKALSFEARSVAAWFLDGPFCTVVPGLVALDGDLLPGALGLPAARLGKVLAELEGAGLLDSDPSGLFFLRALPSWVQSFNPKSVTGWGAVFRDLPPLPFLARVRAHLASFCATSATRSAFAKAIPENASDTAGLDTLSIPYRYPIDTVSLRSDPDPIRSRSDPGESERALAPSPPAPPAPASEAKPKLKRKSVCPEDFEPGPTAVRLAEELGLSGRLGRIRDGFVDYWLAEGRTKLDWQRTFQVWLRRESERSGAQEPRRDALAERRRAEYQARRKAAEGDPRRAVPPPPGLEAQILKLFEDG